MTYGVAQYCSVQTLWSCSDQRRYESTYVALFMGGAREWGSGGQTLAKTSLKMAIKDVKSSMLLRIMNKTMS